MRFLSVLAITAMMMVIITVYLLTQKMSEEENHIHAIAFDPAEPGVYYIATHTILIKHGEIAEDIGDYGTDYMGFTIASDGVFYSSGHSNGIELGFRKSSDKGLSWETIAYEGEDFHDIVTSYADPNVIYAWDTPPHSFLTVSTDGGNTWAERNTTGIIKSFFGLGADHQNPDRVYAATLYGVMVSNDFGENWESLESLENTPTVVVVDDPQTSGVMYVSTNKKGLLKTEDDGKSWVDFNEGLPSASENIVVFMAINPYNSSDIFALLKHGGIYRYDGKRWALTDLDVE
ncbi:MAG TPA: sialidase family protein [Candidatus Nanoarchaeia archaeon]|nr:sialidase family protein [Candidatus Nanoarchaeia archaeon]